MVLAVCASAMFVAVFVIIFHVVCTLVYGWNEGEIATQLPIQDRARMIFISHAFILDACATLPSAMVVSSTSVTNMEGMLM